MCNNNWVYSVPALVPSLFLARDRPWGRLSDNRVYYDLAYYPPGGKDPRSLRRISISVRDHPEYVVRA